MRPPRTLAGALLLFAWAGSVARGGAPVLAAAGQTRDAARLPGTVRPVEPAPRPVVQVPPAVRVGVAGNGTYTVRSIDIEDYVAGVLTGEAARDSDPAVLQALAVAIRTYALKNLNRHRAEGFDVCDETHCQVLRRPTAASTAAAQATAGQVLTWRGALAIVYYSASCGGHTQIPSAVWPGAEDPPYLPSRRDDGCEGNPAWTAELRTRDVEQTLRANGFRGTLKRMRVAARDRSGRVTRLTLDGMRPSSIPGTNLRMAVGPTLIKSMTFDLQQDGDRYRLAGHGYGHGVGMCVIGATRLAARGETAAELLARYYPGTVLGIIDTGTGGPATSVARAGEGTPPIVTAPAVPSAVAAPSTATVPLSRPAAPAPAAPPAADLPPVGDSAAPLREVEALAATARTELAARLGVPVPPALPVVIHRSDADYERTTGRHWFTFGALVRGELHLMPVEQLRQRGVLERIVRRESVHAMVDGILAARPQWVRDGAALYFADPQGSDGEVIRGACPADADLLQPLSAGSLAQAYAGARACFARQVSNGRSWRDVR